MRTVYGCSRACRQASAIRKAPTRHSGICHPIRSLVPESWPPCAKHTPTDQHPDRGNLSSSEAQFQAHLSPPPPKFQPKVRARPPWRRPVRAIRAGPESPGPAGFQHAKRWGGAHNALRRAGAGKAVSMAEVAGASSCVCCCCCNPMGHEEEGVALACPIRLGAHFHRRKDGHASCRPIERGCVSATNLQSARVLES